MTSSRGFVIACSGAIEVTRVHWCRRSCAEDFCPRAVLFDVAPTELWSQRLSSDLQTFDSYGVEHHFRAAEDPSANSRLQDDKPYIISVYAHPSSSH